MKTVTPLTLLCLCDTLLKKPNEAQVTSGGGEDQVGCLRPSQVILQ